MVRAVLREIEQPGTGKTQTRRVLSNSKPNSLFNGQWADSYVLDPGNASWREQELRYAVGDRLYVREHWRTHSVLDGDSPSELQGVRVWYEADPGYKPQSRFRQAMHMPRWASRITLIVTDVRVQRLQEISEEDAIAEGLEGDHINAWRCYLPEPKGQTHWACPRQSFRTLWDSLNAERGFGWNVNAWVAAYTFRPIAGNIDQIAEAA
jgi:hypothetical protein